MANKQQINQVLIQLGNDSIPFGHRYKQLIDILVASGDSDHDSHESCKQIADEVLSRLGNSTVDEKAKAMAKALEQMLKQLELTPLRPATFIQMSNVDGGSVPHALVSMDNGELAHIVAHDQAEAKKLRLGDRIMVDANMKILVHPSLNSLYFGGEARFERKVDERHVEVITHQDMKAVVMAGPDLIKQIDSGEVSSGASVIINKAENLAIRALPAQDGIHYYRYIDRGSVPNVVVDRDIGSPPQVIFDVARHIREEMTRPELRRKFKLRPCITRLLGGVSGTGKTLAVQAMHRLMYEIMAEITRTPIEQLPPRVFRMKSSQMLSMWFGESDKNIDRMFDEVEKVADEKFNGFQLPVMVVLEEADGLGRARGQDNIYDRIMTVVLQRLDPNRIGLSDKLVVFLSTTNEPHMVDPAFLRRIGGEVETFGRLDQKGFSSILRKHVDGLPSKAKMSGIVASVNLSLFGNNAERGVVELHCQGQQQPLIKYRRDFLTGALIDRAVQQAATEAWEMAIGDEPDAGLSAQSIDRAISHQVLAVADQLQPTNVHHYLNLPDGVRVTGVRRLQNNDISVGA